eukprot:gene30693-35720_t
MSAAMTPQPSGKMNVQQRAKATSSARIPTPLCPAPAASGVSTSRLQSSSSASTSQPTSFCSGTSALPRHQAKKLASLFKSHKKQLERIQPAVMSTSEVIAAPSWDLTSDLDVLRRRLALLEVDESNSSDSDSDEEDELSVSGRSLPQIQPTNVPVSPRNYEATGRVMVCQGRKCLHNAEVLQAVSTLAESSSIEVKAVKCVGKCSSGGCAMRVKVEGQASAVYDGFGASSVASIMDSHFLTVSEPEPAVPNPLEALVASMSSQGSSDWSCSPKFLAF